MTGHRKERGLALVELVIVVAIAFVIAGMAVPTFISTRRNFRASGDARNIGAEILLAKMRAASGFTQARVYFDTSAQTFRIEIWDKTNSVWAVDATSGTMSLASGITFGYGPQANPPPNTQASLAQAPACVTGASGASPGSAIASTACITFNSRGIPIDTTGSPTANGAIYITDGSGVYGATLSATGMVRTWRIDATDTDAAHWQLR